MTNDPSASAAKTERVPEESDPPASRLRLRHTRVLRDTVEVAAILIAGIWALYVFIYENRIRPGLEPPTPSISFEMRHVGNDGKLAVIRLDETIHNPGPAEVYFLGYSVTVFGSRVVAVASPRPAAGDALDNTLEAYNTYSAAVPVYREAFVTNLGNPQSKRGLFVEPGQTATSSKEFYVPRKSFDRLTVWVAAVYEKTAQQIPTKLEFERPGSTHVPAGLPKFVTAKDTLQFSTPLAELDLKAE